MKSLKILRGIKCEPTFPILHRPNFKWYGSIIVLTCVILSGSWFISHSNYFQTHSALLSLILTIDIALILPLMYYFIASVKLQAPAESTLIVFIACFGLASLLIPKEHHYFIVKLKILLIAAESTLIIYGIIKIRAIIKTYRSFSETRNDFVFNLQYAFKKLFGDNIALSILQSEIKTLRYGLFFWRCCEEVLPTQKKFSTYKESGFGVVMAVIGFVMVVELFSIHLILWRFGIIVVIIALILSVYGLIFMIADYVSVIKRPFVFADNKLYFRVGIRWNVILELNNIAFVTTDVLNKTYKNEATLDCSLVGNPNCLLVLKSPVIVMGYYGIKKNVDKILFNIDSKVIFNNYIENITRNLIIGEQDELI